MPTIVSILIWILCRQWHPLPFPTNAEQVPMGHLGMEAFLSFISFFFFLIYFHWSLITLQYCGGFCHTSTWIRHRCTWYSQPTPVFLSGESYGQKSLTGYSPRSRRDGRDWATTTFTFLIGKTPASLTFSEIQKAEHLLIKGGAATWGKIKGTREAHQD